MISSGGVVAANGDAPAEVILALCVRCGELLHFTPVVRAALVFFTLAGTHLDLDVIRSAGVLAALIVVGSTAGKYVGALVGATLSDAPPVVGRYLGIALLPKAGITVGLALLVLETPELEPIATVLVSGVLASTLINELLAPPFVKLALVRSGEARTG